MELISLKLNIFISELLCERLLSPESGRLKLSQDETGRYTAATFSCAVGHILWGEAELACELGTWNHDPPTCQLLDCGEPPAVQHGTATLVNRSTMWASEAVYACNQGYIMVVNSTSGTH